jgi:hypothetical protein
MALKPFLETVEAFCDNASHEELKQTIIAFAEEIPVGHRAGFLQRLRLLSPGGKVGPAVEDMEKLKETILDRIEALREDMVERIENIEDGSFWDSGYYDDDDEYGDFYDGEPPLVSEEQVDELMELFDEAGDLFLNDKGTLAQDAYRRLFDLVDEFDELDHLLAYPHVDFDLKEVRARYCRCIYDACDPENRVGRMMDAMDVTAPTLSKGLDLEKDPRPMLRDVMDARTGEMTGWNDFLPRWADALKEQRSHRTAVLRLEASMLLEGPDGPAKLAREWGKSQPRGYLFWIQTLVDGQDWPAASTACLEALDAFDCDPFREQAAGYLVDAGVQLADPALILKGKRERFRSAPTDANLLALAGEAGRQDLRDAELDALADACLKPDSAPAPVEGVTRAKLLLMAGKAADAFDGVHKDKSVGWSFGEAGLVFGGVLYLVCGKADRATTILGIVKDYAEPKIGFSWSNPHDDAPAMYDEIMKGLARCETTAAEAGAFWKWAEKIGRKRIDHIVSNKHRNAYGRAASTLGALAECLILTDRKDEARSLVETFYHDKFSRFSAFRREVKAVFQRSDFLRTIQL